jgi:hypothetical protein
VPAWEQACDSEGLQADRAATRRRVRRVFCPLDLLEVAATAALGCALLEQLVEQFLCFLTGLRWWLVVFAHTWQIALCALQPLQVLEDHTTLIVESTQLSQLLFESTVEVEHARLVLVSIRF